MLAQAMVGLAKGLRSLTPRFRALLHAGHDVPILFTIGAAEALITGAGIEPRLIKVIRGARQPDTKEPAVEALDG